MSYIRADPKVLKLRLSNRPLVIGLTGTIGSGKSSAAELLARKPEVYLVDADILAREVVAPGSSTLADVIHHFGPEIIGSDGSLNRKQLGKSVFADPAKRKLLESLLHPAIRERWITRLHGIKAELTAKKSAESALIVYVVPLLFESNYEYPELDAVVLVAAEQDECIKRIMKRDNCTREAATSRLASQLPTAVKAQGADFVLRNDSTPEALSLAVDSLYQKLLGART